MAQSDVNRLLTDIKINVPGVLEDAILFELNNVLELFCQDSNAWIDRNEFDTIQDEAEYQIFPTDPSGEINRLMGVYDKDDIPVPATMPVIGTLILSRKPDRSGELLKVMTALTPAIPDKTGKVPDMPDWFWSSYYHVIVSGVKGRLFGQAMKSYSNPPMALYHTRVFNAGTAEAKTATMRGNTYNSQPWRFPAGWARRRRAF